MGSFRPRFDRRHDFVVVKPIRLGTGKVLEPGKKIKSGTEKISKLRAWYIRGRIAEYGCAWAERQIDRWKRRAERAAKPSNVQGELNLEQNGTELKDNIEPQIDQNGPWYTVSFKGEELAKINGKRALEEWLKEHGYAQD